MVSIDCLIFGYRKITLSSEDTALAASVLLRAGIASKFAQDGLLIIRERDFSRLRVLFLGKIEYVASEPLGLPGEYKRMPCKSGIFTGIAASFLLCLLLFSLVWDVRVEGNEKIPDSAIVLSLSEAGLEMGDFWLFADKSEIETEFLRKNEDISWINVNRRGTVAYVTVAERAEEENENSESTGAYANIVSDEDCVIEEITVTRGTAMVKVGDTVKKGDVLIAGIISSGEDSSFCYAEGIVRGRVYGSVCADVAREYTYKSTSERKLRNISIKIFDFSINILKIYGNSGKEYDIIKDINTFSLFWGAKLPFVIEKEYEIITTEEKASYTDEQIVSVAASRLQLALRSQLVGADLIKIRTRGAFSDTGYKMYSDIVYSKDVSVIRRFGTDN